MMCMSKEGQCSMIAQSLFCVSTTIGWRYLCDACPDSPVATTSILWMCYQSIEQVQLSCKNKCRKIKFRLLIDCHADSMTYRLLQATGGPTGEPINYLDCTVLRLFVHMDKNVFNFYAHLQQANHSLKKRIGEPCGSPIRRCIVYQT